MIHTGGSIAEFFDLQDSFLNSSEEETAIAILENEEVLYWKEDQCDTHYLDEHNITYFKFNLKCGCTVAAKGNLMIVAKRHHVGGKSISLIFAEELCEYLKKKGINSVACDNNDVMVDGYKTASAMKSEIGNWDVVCFQISINQDIETIEKVCKKPMIKIPKGLGEYGITTEEMLQFCIDYWSKH